jgi:hypothetical protein
MRRVPMGPFSIRLMGPDGLRVTCTCRVFLHLHSTYGTPRLTCHLCLWTCGTPRLACHLCLWTIFHLTCGTRRHLSPSPSDLWDPMTCVSRVPVGPFSISIRPVEPDGFRVTCGPFLHLTCGTRWLACHLLPPGFNKFKLKKTMRPGVEPRS